MHSLCGSCSKIFSTFKFDGLVKIIAGLDWLALTPETGETCELLLRHTLSQHPTIAF